ncbi:MAG: c-type cytochrome, partial [Rhizobiaceae bacterium]
MKRPSIWFGKYMLNKSIIAAALAAFTFITPAIAAGEGAGGDAEKGKKVFKKCKACHAVGDGAKIKVGPPLKDIFGSKAASYEGYKYKKSLKALGEKEGFVWTEDELFAFLKKPKKYLKETLGVKNVKTAMTTKVKKDEKRKDLIAYLKTFSASSASAAVAKVEEAPKVAEETKTDAPKDAEVKTEMASFGGDAEKGKKV